MYVLLHGLNATGAVWRDVGALIESDGGRWIAPDLPGQGYSDWALSYGIAEQASAVAAHIRDAEEVFIIGHSKGALVGMLLATGWFGRDIEGLLGLSTKTVFTEAEMERINAYAASEPRWLDDRTAAEERYLKASGLIGLVDADNPKAKRGVIETDGNWRLATDPRCTIPGGNAYPMFAAVQSQVVMATGSGDEIAPPDMVRAMAPDAIVIADAPHNLHVTHPESVWDLARQMSA